MSEVLEGSASVEPTQTPVETVPEVEAHVETAVEELVDAVEEKVPTIHELLSEAHSLRSKADALEARLDRSVDRNIRHLSSALHSETVTRSLPKLGDEGPRQVQTTKE